MKLNHYNIISAELPTIYDSERFLFLLRTNFVYFVCVTNGFESKVNIWLKKHHIQHISVALDFLFYFRGYQKQKLSGAV